MELKKKEIAAILLAMIVIAVSVYYLAFQNGKKSEQKQDNNQSAVSQRSQAIEVAREFMEKQDFKDQYDLDSAKLDHFPDFWNVWFDKKDQSQRPNKGLVQVDKKTREAQWKLVQ